MKKLFWLCLLLSGLQANAQLLVEEDVRMALRQLAEKQDGYLPVVLVFHNQYNFDSLAQHFEQIQANKHLRVTTVLQVGEAHHRQSLSSWNAALEGWQNQGLLRNLKSSWMINALFFEMQPALLVQLEQRNLPAQLQQQPVFEILQPGKRVADAAPEALNASEPGLRTIKANFMWQLGYSGLGQMAYVYDSGTRNEHPALREQHLANRFSLSWAWRSFHGNVLPTDRDEEHGTHVAGTILGLEKANNDTIGVAPAAYFISNDIIPSGALNGTIIVDAYQYALNPDGNAATTFDVPDVINNSWGGTASQFLCNFMSGTFAALEAAGIGNIYAAGNDGPNPFTVGLYGAVAADSLRNFSVGNINAQNASWPINTTSSRGPTVCANTAPLNIKPEVSAPGTNIRSSVNENGYSLYTGTSMASPHVSGAYLLLKEAFPTASPRQLLNALYQTAIDLGDPGEDNVYGRGMIDLQAAYIRLSQQFTPATPNARRRDLALIGLENRRDGNRICTQVFSAQENMIVKNVGRDTVTNFTIQYGYNAYTSSTSWSGNLRPGQQIIIPLTLLTPLPAALTEFTARVISTGAIDRDTVNNYYAVRMRRQDGTTAFGNMDGGVHQNFSDASILGSSWFINNIGNDAIGWETHVVNGLPGTFNAMKVRMGGYSPASGQRDELISPYFTPAGSGNINLHFRMAYRNRTGFNNDSLMVYMSTDCAVWTEIYRDGGSSMVTYNVGTEPTQAAHWRTVSIPNVLPANTKVSLKFVTRNGFGGNLYLTNVSYGWLPLGTGNETAPAFKVYPNPSSGTTRVSLESGGAASELLLTDLQGRLLQRHILDPENREMELDLGQLQSGLYLVQLQGPGGKRVEKLVKQ